MNVPKFPKLPQIKSIKDLPRGTLKFIIGAVVTVMLVHTVFGPKGVVTVVTLYRQCKDIQNDITSEQNKIDSLTVVEHRLKTDRAYIERSARELLGVRDTAETVIKFVDPQE